MSQRVNTQFPWPSLWLGTTNASGIFGRNGEMFSIPSDTSGSLLRWHKAFEFRGYIGEDLARILKNLAGDTREGLEVSIEYYKQAIDYVACTRGQIFFNSVYPFGLTKVKKSVYELITTCSKEEGGGRLIREGKDRHSLRI